MYPVQTFCPICFCVYTGLKLVNVHKYRHTLGYYIRIQAHIYIVCSRSRSHHFRDISPQSWSGYYNPRICSPLFPLLCVLFLFYFIIIWLSVIMWGVWEHSMHHRIKIHMSAYIPVDLWIFLKRNERNGIEGILRTKQLLLIYLLIKLNTTTEHEHDNVDGDQVNFFEIRSVQREKLALLCSLCIYVSIRTCGAWKLDFYSFNNYMLDIQSLALNSGTYFFRLSLNGFVLSERLKFEKKTKSS